MKNTKYTCLLFAIVGSLLIVSCKTSSSIINKDPYKKISPFGIDYSKISARQVGGYDLLIVDPSEYNKSDITNLKATGATILAYLSVGEVEKHRWYFEEMKQRGFLGKNPNWGAYYLNLADSVTYSLFFKKIIPKIMSKGFDGLFLDTIDDVAPYSSRNQLQPYMVKLIRQIRATYPNAMIIQNDGTFLLNKTADVINAVIIEDVATNYNFKNQSYSLRGDKSYHERVQEINSYSERYSMPFLIVDYANNDSIRSLAIKRLNSITYPYFISNINLDDIQNGYSGNNY
ncbi:MAG TPA: endo alpha-1,4 polygalactosaminidase [Balneolaceae bacterium]|nr:endo alpha-1,4 polygalactosaminidase [Balneolaceae bacterium]